MSGYHAAGVTNLVFYAIALLGTAHQLREISRRKAAASPGEPSTSVISLNQLMVSFAGYYTFFVYGYCVRPFNHYLVWPRLVGLLLVLAIVRELARDRRERSSTGAYVLGVAMLLPALGVLIVQPELSADARRVPQILAVVATLLVVQGFAHQIVLVRRAGHLGAISVWMHVATFVKDFSLAALGFAMGVAQGWPLMLMGGASVSVKSVLLGHLWAYRRGAVEPGR